MHLAIDAVGAKHSGAATILLDVLDAATWDARIDRISLFCSPASLRQFELPTEPKLIAIEQPAAESSAIQRVIWHENGIGKACERVGADIVFCMSNAGRGTQRIPHVTLIQQSLPFWPEALRTLSWSDQLRMKGIKESMQRSCLMAQRIIVQTPVMADWVSTAFNLPLKKFEVVIPVAKLMSRNLAYVSDLEEMRKVPDNRRILYVGGEQTYKKIDILVTALFPIRNQFPDAHLFLTLPKSHRYSNVPGVVCLGYLKPNDLCRVYSMATALVLPSLVETVGMPMLEAMKMGVPVIAADRPYAHSVCEDAAIYFDPHDPAEFAQCAIRLMSDLELRQHLVEKGIQLSKRREAKHPYDRIMDVLWNYAKKS